MEITQRLKGCLVGGAIGDALGSEYEGTGYNTKVNLNFDWYLSDDTQLTLATCEAICGDNTADPAKIATTFTQWYNNGKLSGLGQSTIIALKALQAGSHWASAGNSGEYAAGNGAAMRISPLAFKNNLTLQTVKDVCNITHNNNEAYAGALAVYCSIRAAILGDWQGDNNLIGLILDNIPESLVKNRLLELDQMKNKTILEIGKKYYPSGYVVDSATISVFAAQKINSLDFKSIMYQLVHVGGDTDTTCAMAGNIIGSLKGPGIVPEDWMRKYNSLGIKGLVDGIVGGWVV